MTIKERESCINTIEILRRLAFNVHGVMDAIDAENCEKIVEMLKQPGIIYCKDCKHRYIENMTWHCPFGLMGGEDFFCGYGSLGRAERRSDAS